MVCRNSSGSPRKGSVTHTLVFEDGFFFLVLFVTILFVFAVIDCRTQQQDYITVKHQNRGYVPREEGGLFDGGRDGAAACSVRALDGGRGGIGRSGGKFGVVGAPGGYPGMPFAESLLPDVWTICCAIAYIV